ncbi:MAG: DUF5693 family protein [Elusimicrobia bacterium]|nr:DUF5693 family protein [Candidatus Obscuribacterium magneticum]
MSKTGAGLTLAFGILLGAFLSLGGPDLVAKIEAQKGDRVVALANDWEDLRVFSVRENKSAERILALLSQIPIHVIAATETLSPEDEKTIRQRGFQILWRPSTPFVFTPSLLKRVKPGDGLWSDDEKVIGYPLYLKEVADTLSRKDGFLPIDEFACLKGVNRLASMGPRLIKAHLLASEELVQPNVILWRNRLVRAVKERWVRFLFIRYVPGFSLEKNLLFQKSASELICQTGFQIGPMRGSPSWPTRLNSPFFSRFRLKVALLFSILAPLLGLYWIKKVRHGSIILSFLLMSFFSLLVGISIHALGAVPKAALGFMPLTGVKIQLLSPLLLGGVILLKKHDIHAIMETPLKGKHFFVAGIICVLVIGFYVMRSGNFPFLPVSDWERMFRDRIETLLTVRPRFKEFAIGHPLFILGLYLIKGKTWLPDGLKDGRLFLWMGLIGQISILNTFFHFHTPFHDCVLRTLHGLWIGLLLSGPLIWAVSLKKRP